MMKNMKSKEMKPKRPDRRTRNAARATKPEGNSNPSTVVPKIVPASVETPPKDEDLWDVPAYSNSQPNSSGYVQNLDFSGFSAVLETSYQQLRALDPRVERQMPFCVYQHSMISRLNAHIIRYTQIENNENRYSDEGSPYDIFGVDKTSLAFPDEVYEYLHSIGKNIIQEGDFIKVNIPTDAVPKDSFAAVRQADEIVIRAACDSDSFGPINAENHNLYECYASPLISKKLVQEAQTNPDGPAGDWFPLPTGFYPEESIFTKNCIGYKPRERIAPEFRNQLNDIMFSNSNNMSGRLCYSPQIEHIVNNYLNSKKKEIVIKNGFPAFKMNSSIIGFLKYDTAIERTQFGVGLKIRPKFLGPYRVVAVKGFDRYRVEKVGDGEGSNVTNISADKMKPWINDDDVTDVNQEEEEVEELNERAREYGDDQNVEEDSSEADE